MFNRLKKSSRTTLSGQGINLRLPQTSDFADWLELRIQSKEFLVPFEPKWPELAPTRENFSQRVKNFANNAAKGSDYSFFIFADQNDFEQTQHPILVGGITLSNIRYRAAHHANIGYWLGQAHIGKNYMGRAMALCQSFAFETLNLRRIHAACMPHNQSSINVLKKSGFQKEGFAEQYLQINGEYRDHELFGLTANRYAAIKGK